MDIFQVDAFAKQLFEGNPAAVIPLEKWLDDEALQAIAQENNLAETAFFVSTGEKYHLRWFTPSHEVKLCGHATLASAHVLFMELNVPKTKVVFSTLSGDLMVTKNGQLYEMDFPTQAPSTAPYTQALRRGLNVNTPVACLASEDYIIELANEQAVLDVAPNFNALLEADLRGVIVTSAARDYDFVARFFGPKVGVAEDSVTGSAYTQLAPYWSQKLGKTQMCARQVAKRGGDLVLNYCGARTRIAGSAVTYLRGHISI